MSPKRHLPMPELAYRNPNFMESLPGRPLRILAEYLDPFTCMRREKVADTIVIFGSARLAPRQTALAHLDELKRRFARKKKKTHANRLALRAAKSRLAMSRYYEEARELAHRLTGWSMTLGKEPRRFVGCSGGGPGIMEAANRGASEAGGPSMGLSIQLPHEQYPNSYISPELNFCFHYFFMRKLWFAQMAKALIVFPGGFGTMDEMWEILTLMQTGKLSSHHLILIYGREYWDKVLDWEAMVVSGTISEREFKLLKFSDNVDDAFNQIRAALERYHLPLDKFI